MAELVPGLPYAEFVRGSASFTRERDFRRSEFFARWGQAVDELLATPRVEIAVAPRLEPAARPEASFRITHWNVEKGKQLGGLVRRFREDALLAEADVVTLNEVDVGMARAGPNADVARDLARAYGGGHAYLPCYVECTKGPGAEGVLPIENERGLHGLAILTRWPILRVARHPLPSCWDYFDFAEKRYGLRQGLYVLLGAPFGPLVVGTTHLEVRRTPVCRARQFERFLAGLESVLESWGRDLPVVLTGDWNTNSFPRGGWRNSILGFSRIVSTGRARLDRELRFPEAREPLFDVLREHRFEWDGLNDRGATGFQRLGEVEDLALLPAPAARALLRFAGIAGRTLGMRLDWIAARGLMPGSPPLTAPAEGLSDHHLISADLRALTPGADRSENRETAVR